MTIAKMDYIRQRIAADTVINNATPAQRATLLANWMLSPAQNLLLIPDYRPAIIDLLPALVGDCTHKELPFSAAAPVVCSNCRKQVGTVNGLATGTRAHFAHADCVFNFREPPWFLTPGFHAIAAAAFRGNTNKSTALLSHYIITEYLKNEQRKREQYAAQGSSDGFEFISSLDCGSTEQQVCSHDNAGRYELSTAGGSNQLPVL